MNPINEADKQIADLIRESDPKAGFTRGDCYKMYKAHCRRTLGRRIDLGKMFERLAIRPLMPGSLTTIVANTGTSKTWILMHMTRYFTEHKMCLFEMELTAEQIIERDLAIQTRQGIEEVYIQETTGDEDLYDYSRDTDNLRIFDCANLTVEDMADRISCVEHEIGKIDIVMIDYMGLVSGVGSRYERATDNAQRIKRLAKNKQVAVIVISQVARKGDDRYRPITMFDAKDSGDIENSSSTVIGMWPHKVEPNCQRWLRVLKNNDVGTGAKAQLYNFNWRTSTFERGSETITPDVIDWATGGAK